MNDFYQSFFKTYTSDLIKIRSTKKSFKVRGSKKLIILSYLEKFINSLVGIITKGKVNASFVTKKNEYLDDLEKYKIAYDWLEDDFSKQRYLQYLSFKLISSNWLEFDINHLKWDEATKEISKCIMERKSYPQINKMGALYDLSAIGHNVKIIGHPRVISILFILQQYSYKNLFQVNQNDIVIDCGGATGDTALWFASMGASKIYSFEFIKSSIEMITEHLKLNPGFVDKIEIVKAPVWSVSGEELSYIDKGNASQVAKKGVYPNSIITQSIDDLMASKNDDHVDLIKMDIEGAEIPALEGAKETIKKYKPKLAISVYHKSDDLLKIPEYIKSLNPDYKFYFECYTNVGWEAVLYAIDEKASN